MANPGEFRRIVADVLDLPIATVTSFDRLLSEAGLRSKAGRGRGAAQMTAADAARSLTAIMASAQVKDAVASIERYTATRLHRATSTPGGFANCGISQFESLNKEHSFVDALEALIVWIAKGASRAGATAKGIWAESIPIIEVMAATPGTVGDIRISGIGDSVLAVRYALPVSRKGAATWDAEIRARALRSDLEQFRRISGRTVFQIGEALADDN